MIQSEKPRKVNILEQRRGTDGKTEFVKCGEGFFHGFCQEGEGNEMGCNAVIELPDGRVTTYWLKAIQFVEPLK